MQKTLTVGELKQALIDIPDNLEVTFSSDTMDSYDIILTDAYRVKYELPDGRVFADTGESGVDRFTIYGNVIEDDDDDEDDDEDIFELTKDWID